MAYDYLIVGAGFTGATMARLLAEAGKRVLIIDKRDHIGGNAYDYLNEDGIRIHKYGPHIFHTNSDKVFEFLSRFTEWTPYEHRVQATLPDGSTVPFPIQADGPITDLEVPEHGITNAEEQCLATVGRANYELFFKGYTTKMWGVTPDKLDKSVTARIPIRFDRDERYFTDKHQAMPRDGYTDLFERMLDHENIEVMLGFLIPHQRFDRFVELDLRVRHAWHDMPTVWQFAGRICQHLIFTGPIDQFYNEALGKLPYRSLRFDHQTWRTDRPIYQLPAPVVNFPPIDMKPTRVTEWAQLQGEPSAATVLTYEFPTSEGEPFYPVPSPEARALYKRYEALADKETNVTFLGRLGSYQYLNMDQAVGQAMAAFARLVANPAR